MESTPTGERRTLKKEILCILFIVTLTLTSSLRLAEFRLPLAGQDQECCVHKSPLPCNSDREGIDVRHSSVVKGVV